MRSFISGLRRRWSSWIIDFRDYGCKWCRRFPDMAVMGWGYLVVIVVVDIINEWSR
jgi:hypothetical protein